MSDQFSKNENLADSDNHLIRYTAQETNKTTGGEKLEDTTKALIGENPTATHEPQTSGPTPPEMVASLLDELSKAVIGQDRMQERIVCAMLSGGHVLLEGVPGVGKTMTLTTLAKVVGGQFARIQFTSDLLPSDIVGTRIYSVKDGTFSVEKGPIFANFVLADEINRAPAKVQSALLEVMAEGQVTVSGSTFKVPDPFLVLATQNPIESEGVFPLPEAQRDRFMMRVIVDLPTIEEERGIAMQYHAVRPEVSQRISLNELKALQRVVSKVEIPDQVVDYAVRLTMASRDPNAFGLSNIAPLLRTGVSPRATLALLKASKAMAVLRGRALVSAQDVYDVAFDVLNHRLILSYDALADGVSPFDVTSQILRKVPAPHGSR
jgi:MoxR-like ATPase